jgi:hypothetical protein
MHALADARRQTLLHHGTERLRRLCSVLGFDIHDEQRMVELFVRMGLGWGTLRCGGRPRWLSDITDDHSPFEFSIAIQGGDPELRILCEIQDDFPSVQSNWKAALSFNNELVTQFGASIDRFRSIQDLFTPTSSSARFGLWHAVCFKPGVRPDFKLYLNPALRGRSTGRAVIEEAMTRLGFGNASDYLRSSSPDDSPIYFSLDLSDSDHARVKAYTAHFNATASHVESALRSVRGYVPGQVTEFCRAMGGGDYRFDARPIQTCLAFTSDSSAPTSGTVYFPVRSYADSDLEVRERVLGYVHSEGAAIYRRALDAFANRPLEGGVGMQTYVSMRQAPGPRRLTVYLSPEVYAVDRGSRAGIVSGIVRQAPVHRLPGFVTR